MAILIQLKRGTASAWASVNPILAEGEPGYETDTKKEKIGDGVTPWNGLGYKASGGGAFPIITIASRPWELRKTVNLNDVTKANTLEVGDVIFGSPSAGEFLALKYLGGDNTLFNDDTIYTPITGI